jgi:hypothetical protein
VTGVVVQAYNSDTQKAEVGGSWSGAGAGKSSIPSLKSKLKQKGAGCMTQVVEHLPSKLKALSLKPCTTQNKKQNKTKSVITLK